MWLFAFDSSGKEPNQHRTYGTSSEGSGGQVGTYDDMVTVRSDYESSEVERYYRVYVPRRYDPSIPTPIMVALGGFSVDMYWLAEFTELNRMADRGKFHCHIRTPRMERLWKLRCFLGMFIYKPIKGIGLTIQI